MPFVEEKKEFDTFVKVVEHCKKMKTCMDCKYYEVCDAYYDDEYLPKKANGWWVKEK